jgi:aminoglycoside/choline kinase family phosphotransferase
MSATTPKQRDQAIAAFLRTSGWGEARSVALKGDASFRRYFRLCREGPAGLGETVVLMDAPPPGEDVRPFSRVADHLAKLRLSAPKILAADTAAGLLLLEDLGDDTYTRVLEAKPESEAALYELAADTLIALHLRFDPAGSDIQHFDDARAVIEAERFLDWFWPAAVGEACPDTLRTQFRAAWKQILPAWRGVPESLILFDYHVDNLLVVKDRAGVAACGLLDFQDGVIGPVSFDLMSLLQDVRRDVSNELTAVIIGRYLAAFPALDPDAFAASFAVGGAQRNIRILGTFIRLWRRDGKPGYLNWMPRTWAMVEKNLSHPACAPLAAWFARNVPARLRTKRLDAP